MYTALHDFTANINTSQSQYKNAGTLTNTRGLSCMSSILWTNKWMFWPTAIVDYWNYNAFYCDYTYVNASRIAYAGGVYDGSPNSSSSIGLFFMNANISTSNAYDDVWSRLMYL